MESQLFESLIRKLRDMEVAHPGTLGTFERFFREYEGDCNECLTGKFPAFWLSVLQVMPTVDFSDRWINVIMPAPEWDESEPHWVLRVEKGSECVQKVFYRGRTQKEPGVIAQGEAATARMKWVIENLELIHLTGEKYGEAIEDPVPAIRFLRGEVRKMLEDEAVR